jgi:hypothetical protein
MGHSAPLSTRCRSENSLRRPARGVTATHGCTRVVGLFP